MNDRTTGQISRFWSNVDKNGPIATSLGTSCWVWTAAKDHGYGITWSSGRVVSGSTEKAHRVSWFIEHGEWPKLCILHKCDNRACVRPDHLFEGTYFDNVRDMISKGRDRHPGKLSPYDVQEIVERKQRGEMGIDLAREFGVCPKAISVIGRIRFPRFQECLRKDQEK